jgi:PilZ domain
VHGLETAREVGQTKDMYDQGDGKNTSKAAASETERRDGNRHPFIAAADVVELASGSRFSTRTTDLGPGGCFVDTMVPFDAGARVRVSIREGQTRFEATGMIVYSQSGLGMGIAFDTLKADQQKALAVWLGEEVDEHQQAQESVQEPWKPGLPHGSDREALLRLVKLLTNRGLLTAADAASIFSDPVFF